METHRTFNAFHLGDNLVHLHFLRHLSLRYPGRSFLHAAHGCHLPQLREVIADRPNIALASLDECDTAGAIDAWKNAEGFFQQHGDGADWCGFHLDWFRHLAGKMGLESPFARTEDLLFDYSLLNEEGLDVKNLCGPGVPLFGKAFDFLVINSRPCSGQFMVYDRVEYFDPLLERLVAAGQRVLVTQPTEVKGVKCTMDHGLTVTQIGQLSRFCTHHLMMSTGPSWPCLNRWNLPSKDLRLLFLAGEHIDFPSLQQVNGLPQCEAILRERGLL